MDDAPLDLVVGSSMAAHVTAGVPELPAIEGQDLLARHAQEILLVSGAAEDLDDLGEAAGAAPRIDEPCHGEPWRCAGPGGPGRR